MNNRNRRFHKFIYIYIIIIFSCTILIVVRTNSVYPIPIGVAIIAVPLSVLYYQGMSDDYCIPPVLVSLFYTVMLFLVPAHLVGGDPDVFAIFAHLTLISGDSPILYNSFYSNAPYFHIFIAQVSMLFDLKTTTSVIVIPVLVGLLVPLLVYMIARSVSNSNNTPQLSALFSAVLPLNIYIGYWTVPQSIGLIFFLLIVYYLSEISAPNLPNNIVQQGGSRKMSLIFIFMLSSVYLHKLILPSLLVCIIFYYILSIVSSILLKKQKLNTGSLKISIGLITGLIILFQMIFATDYFLQGTLLISNTLDASPSLISGVGSTNPELGVHPESDFPFYLLKSHSHAIIMIIIAGLVWTYEFVNNSDKHTYILSVVAGTTSIVVITGLNAFSSSAVSPVRTYMFAGPLLAILIAIAVTNISSSTRFKSVKIVLLVLFVSSQVFSAAALPVFPNEPRSYLTSSEVEAKGFGHEYIEEPVYTDLFYAYQKATQLDRITSKTHPAVTPPWVSKMQYRSISRALFENKSLLNDIKYISYRHNVDVYFVQPGIWKESSYRLTWEPENRFMENRNKIYSNSDVSYFTTP